MRNMMKKAAQNVKAVAVRAGTVSYTHLDVYKRQEERSERKAAIPFVFSPMEKNWTSP